MPRGRLDTVTGVRAYLRRFARIVPAYTVACAAEIVVTVVFPGGAIEWGPISTSFLLLQS